MGEEKTVYFFRHGETDWNVAGKFQGHEDTELNANGLAQAAALAEFCKDLGIGLVVSSDLRRASSAAPLLPFAKCSWGRPRGEPIRRTSRLLAKTR